MPNDLMTYDHAYVMLHGNTWIFLLFCRCVPILLYMQRVNISSIFLTIIRPYDAKIKPCILPSAVMSWHQKVLSLSKLVML